MKKSHTLKVVYRIDVDQDRLDAYINDLAENVRAGILTEDEALAELRDNATDFWTQTVAHERGDA